MATRNTKRVHVTAGTATVARIIAHNRQRHTDWRFPVIKSVKGTAPHFVVTLQKPDKQARRD